MAEVSEINNYPDSPSRRLFLKHIIGTTVLIGTIGIDWKMVIDGVVEHFREPSIEATPLTIPNDQPVYEVFSGQTLSAVTTLFSSKLDYDKAIEKIDGSKDIAELQINAESVMFGKFAARVAIGNTQIGQEWEDYALSEAERITGYPVKKLPEELRKIDAKYGTPDLDSAKFATSQSCEYAAAIPISLLQRAGILECSYVAGLQLTSPLFDKTIENGASGPSFGGMIVDCLDEKGYVRESVGSQWLHQFGFFVDFITANTPHTYNDIEMAQLIPGMEAIESNRLDYPDKNDVEVFNIASTKVDRIKEILSGEIILPTDSSFGSIQQKQQELLLRRIIATFPEIPRNYFEQVTLYRKENLNTLPQSSSQLQ